MLYYLNELTDWFSPLRVFRYVTFRAMGGAGTAFLLSLLLGPWLIERLRRLKVGQPSRMGDAPKLDALHRPKAGTPTMGGLLIVLTVTLAALLWAIPTNGHVLLSLATMIFMGAIGFWDDFLKVTKRNAKGLSARLRLAMQTAWAVAVVGLLWADGSTRFLVRDLMVPFFKEPILALPLPVAMGYLFLVLVGSTNAVNLTDGLDGLAIGCTNAVALAYLIFAYVTGHAIFADYLQLRFVPGSSELAVFCGCLLGAGLGFLWYNCHPARVFMGDTGSLALGGAIAMVAILVQQTVTLVFVGGVFVMEALSVLLQVAFFKATGGRRIFKCAPLHHHFEILEKERAVREGRDMEVVETMVTIRFWILSIIFALLGVATLKIR